jgi:hypothetical protein
MSAGNQGIQDREVLGSMAAAEYFGVSRSHLSHIPTGKAPGVPPIPHFRAGRRALVRKAAYRPLDVGAREGHGPSATAVRDALRNPVQVGVP